MTPVPTEKDVLRQCRQLLTHYRIFHWRCNTGAIKFAPNEGDPRFVRFGVPGISDIVGVVSGRAEGGEPFAGRFLAVEVKGPKGKLSGAQAAFFDAVRAAGGLAFVVRDVRDLEVYLRSEGIL